MPCDLLPTICLHRRQEPFQFPFLRDMPCDWTDRGISQFLPTSFSSLFFGICLVTSSIHSSSWTLPDRFQFPFLRDMPCDDPGLSYPNNIPPTFQFPFLRDMPCDSRWTPCRDRSWSLSVPFSSGYALWPGSIAATHKAMGQRLSVPFSSGYALWPQSGSRRSSGWWSFQFPFLRDMPCDSSGGIHSVHEVYAFQFPFLRDMPCDWTMCSLEGEDVPYFQFPFLRDMPCDQHPVHQERDAHLLSVPFSSGYALWHEPKSAPHRHRHRFQFPFLRDMPCDIDFPFDEEEIASLLSVPFSSGYALWQKPGPVDSQSVILSVPFSSGYALWQPLIVAYLR